jgi:hypothetical protein
VKRSWICLLMVLAVVAGGALVACGGGSNDKKATPTTEAQEQQQEESTPSTKATTEKKTTPTPKSNSGSSDSSLGDVPVYPGATKLTSGEWSGSEGAMPAIGSDVNAGDYNNVAYAMYETNDSPQDVLDWYKDKMSGWKDEGSFSGGSEGEMGAYAAWTKDDGKVAAWITVGESEGTTSLGIWTGTQ